MKTYDFIEPELEFYREFCNFTEDERKLFDLRAREVSLEQCAEEMCCYLFIRSAAGRTSE